MVATFSRAVIVARFLDGEPLKFTRFWSEGLPDPRAYFNQWHPSKFEYRGFPFENAEQAMMAEKAALFADFGTLARIFNTPSPRAVKALGREVSGYVDGAWADVRLARVVEISVAKYSQNVNMLQALLATGDSVLVEASPEDRIWGIGMSERDHRCHNPTLWEGENLLGEALMITRQLLAPMTHEE